MTGPDLALAASGALAVAGGVLAVTSARVVHAALWLVVALLGVAASLLGLGGELVALILILVYVGAIVVLVLFALMLTRAPVGPDTTHAVTLWRRLGAYAGGAATSALLLAVLLPLTHTAAGDWVLAERRLADTGAVAADLFGVWVWPFEALSILLLAALVAGLALTRGRRGSS